jgi:site-specific DNA-cytosine methylase
VIAAHNESGDKIPGRSPFVTLKVALTSIGNARRINVDAGAHTLLTTSGPGGKYTGPVHYDQVRTLTVAERKRIQGVPDNYTLVGNVHDVCLDQLHTYRS